MMKTMLAAALGLGLGLGLTGCSSDGQTSVLPNPDGNLQRTSAEFAADAAKRQYEAEAPRDKATDARAQYEIMTHRIDIVNLADADWSDVEVWINHEYVVYLPSMQKMVDEKLDYEMFFDRDGHHFESKGGANPLQSIEIYRDGKMYDVTATAE
jgi:hypothetical protein